MKDYVMVARGCLSLFVLGALVLVLVASIARSFADWQVSANDATVAVQTTEQTRIEWDAHVEIERIRADVTKKTDVTFVLFWLLRALLWGAGVIATLAVGVFLWGGRRE